MAQQHPTLKIPFQNISGLPSRAQYEIRRDFEEIARLLTAGSASLYDAVIDPALASSQPGNHKYKNITDFTVGENALITSTRVMVVAVIGRPGTPVVETSDITLNGPVIFVGGGITAGSPFSTGARPVIDFNAHHITVTGSNWVTFQQIELSNSNATTVNQLVIGNAALYDCMVNALAAGITSINIVASAVLYAHNSGFSGNLGHGLIRTFCFDCVQEFSVAGVTIGGATQYFLWDGGSFDTGSAATLTVTAAYYIDTTYDAFLGGGATGTGLAVNLGNGSTGYLSIHSVSTTYPTLTVTALAGDCVVDGNFSSLTVNGNTNHTARNFRCSIPGGGGVDLTGPCKADLSISNALATSTVKLRGLGNHVNVALETLSGGTTPLQLIGATDSLVTMQFPAGSGVAPYTIDAASARCVLVLAGTSDAWGAGTNAGTNCLVITELGIVGSASTDSTRKDLIPSLLVGDVAGVQTIPTPAPGSAPTGPAGGSLNGTYPNPSLAGRDSSVDQINKDMLPSLLVEASGPLGVAVYGAAADAGLAQSHDLSGTWPFQKVTGLAGQKVSASSPADQDLLQYVTGLNLGWINVPFDKISVQGRDFTKDFMLMGG